MCNLWKWHGADERHLVDKNNIYVLYAIIIIIYIYLWNYVHIFNGRYTSEIEIRTHIYIHTARSHSKGLENSRTYFHGFRTWKVLLLVCSFLDITLYYTCIYFVFVREKYNFFPAMETLRDGSLFNIVFKTRKHNKYLPIVKQNIMSDRKTFLRTY